MHFILHAYTNYNDVYLVHLDHLIKSEFGSIILY